MAPQDMPSQIGGPLTALANGRCRNGAIAQRFPLPDGAKRSGQKLSRQVEFSILVMTSPSSSRSTLNRILSTSVNPLSIAGSLTRKFMVTDSM